MIGSFADWATASLALGAAVIAGLAAKATIETNRAQQETLRLQQEQFAQAEIAVEREQAEMLAFWSLDDELREFMIINASHLPIYDVEIVAVWGHLDGSPDRGLCLISERFILPTGGEPLKVARAPENDRMDICDYPFRDVAEIELHFADARGFELDSIYSGWRAAL